MTVTCFVCTLALLASLAAPALAAPVDPLEARLTDTRRLSPSDPALRIRLTMFNDTPDSSAAAAGRGQPRPSS